ncbi:MAG: LicD family protein [Proteobacteria bacterium]|nr:LicD family protein [Pseudomonadota bacterium]
MPIGNAGLLVDMLLLTVSIFEQYGVSYTVHHGALLGALRLQGLLPWDIDADLFLAGETEATFHDKVATALADHGLSLERRGPGYFIIRPRLSIAGLALPLFPMVEVDLLRETRTASGEAVYDQHAAHRRWDAGELLPLRRYPFYGSYLMGPHAAEPVMERLYQGAGSERSLKPFRRPGLPPSTDEFWRSKRPRDGRMDWPAVSRRGQEFRRSILWRCLTCAPWYLANSLYCLMVQTFRRYAGGHIE